MSARLDDLTPGTRVRLEFGPLLAWLLPDLHGQVGVVTEGDPASETGVMVHCGRALAWCHPDELTIVTDAES